MQNHKTLCDALAGRLVVFEGPDGSGKSTQFARFSAFCSDHGTGVTEVREPGGTGIGEEIRRLLLAPSSPGGANSSSTASIFHDPNR